MAPTLHARSAEHEDIENGTAQPLKLVYGKPNPLPLGSVFNRSGYDQHTSPKTMLFPEYYKKTDAKILNILIEMKKDNKSDYTINFTRKVLTYLSKHTRLEERSIERLA